ncbi:MULTISPECIES: TrmB family transcriptional regulator sugar-binding domain-containing protein [Halomicrobium]|uniref:Transcription regulator TrmB C-terminal domain-containing protein n=2 Tax=Halomicrobium mukohataei TaxID=57705 RepID=C7NWH9_HALMD|nr:MULTISPECIES: TrmB family transcriptional regulator sugar-binding domain-containing protein [Halomicrobium]ACV46320.1 conserved hypothetical protein [Halomicrobium mukohataei DSM 12286]QCD64877.1 hypothetical protein E5139_04210 [Halomicrobium mukohataei]QFR19683.1 hypothetical protein GBQ70_04205 [Halomicrobium sp. ZPS1]
MTVDTEVFERDAILDRVRELADSAVSEVALSVPHTVLPELDATLSAAVDRGLLVLVLVWDPPHDERSKHELPSLAGRSTVARRSQDIAPVFCCVDNERGLIGNGSSITDDGSDDVATTFDFQEVAHGLYRDFVTNFWMFASEIHARAVPELPVAYDGIRHAVTNVALCLRDEVAIRCRATGRDPETGAKRTVDGRVLNVHQRMVYPASSSLPIENSILVEDDGRQWIGGPHAVLEDVAAERLSLRRA